MSEIAQLITALSALVTSIGGALAAVIVAIRTGRKQRNKIKESAKNEAEVNTLGEGEEDGLSIKDAQELLEFIGKLQNTAGSGSGSGGGGPGDDAKGS